MSLRYAGRLSRRPGLCTTHRAQDLKPGTVPGSSATDRWEVKRISVRMFTHLTSGELLRSPRGSRDGEVDEGGGGDGGDREHVGRGGRVADVLA